MATLTFAKNDLPFLLDGAGKLAVDAAALNPTAPVGEIAESLLDVSIDAGGADKIRLGLTDTIKVSIASKSRLALTIIQPASKSAATTLTAYGLGEFFKDGAHENQIALIFEAGASVDAGASSTFLYSALRADVELEAGVDVGYAYVRALDRALPVAELAASVLQHDASAGAGRCPAFPRARAGRGDPVPVWRLLETWR